MKVKIKKRLAELYKEQTFLTDKDKHWIQATNGPRRSDLIKTNYAVIKELENLLK